MTTKGLYVHIPFCKSRCIYCGFYSTVGGEGLMDRYVDCLLKELSLKLDFLKDISISTIYVGGGTPSSLPLPILSRLISGLYRLCHIKPESLSEFTVECNPDDISPDYARQLRKMGISRVSMGAQTFSDSRLRFIRRRHNSKQISSAVECLRSAGISNVSIDLMFGFPSETLSDWNDDISQALQLGVQHISAYSLMYEEGTPLYRLLAKGDIKPLDEDVCREMFEVLIERLSSAGYEHYEISNFALPGFRSRHNSSYWHDIPYIGIGASAHSYYGLTRQWNVSDIQEYMSSISSGIIPCDKETIDSVTHYNDIVTTALRTKEGIDVSTLDSQFKDYILKNAQKSLDNGNMIFSDNHLRLSRKALFISDDIMSDLIFLE